MSTWTCLGSSAGISPLRTGAVVLHDSLTHCFWVYRLPTKKCQVPLQVPTLQISDIFKPGSHPRTVGYTLQDDLKKGVFLYTVGSQKDCTRSSDHKWSYQWCYNVSNCMLKTQFWCVRHLTRLTLRPQRQRRFCRDRFAFVHVGAAAMTRQQSELSTRTPRSSKDILRRKFQDLCISVPWCFAIIAQARLGVTNMVTSSLLTVDLFDALGALEKPYVLLWLEPR